MTRKNAGNILLFILALFLFSGFEITDYPRKRSLDPKKLITQYTHKVWATNIRFAQNSINVISQSSDGFLLLGTNNGLLRFDGINFSKVDLGFGKIKSNIVVSAILNTKEAIWVGTSKGLVKLVNWKPVPLNDSSGNAAKDIFSLCEGPDGVIWIGTNLSGIVRYSNGKFSDLSWIPQIKTGVIYSIAVDRENNLWAGTNGGGLFKISRNSYKQFTVSNGLVNNVVHSVMVDYNNNIWIGTNAGIQVIKKDKMTSFTRNEGLTTDVISTIMQDSRKTIWIGTNGGGLNKFHDGKFTSFTYKDGLPNDIINSIFEDSEGNLWVGTRVGFLNQLKNSFSTIYTVREGISNNFIRSITEGKSGAIWIGTNGDGVNKIDQGKITTFNSANGLSHGVVRSVLEDSDGFLWVGTYGGGLNKLVNNRFQVYNHKNGFLNDVVMSMIETTDKKLWVGTGAGIAIMGKRSRKYESISNSDGLNHNYIRALMQDSKGNVWIGSSRGVNIFTSGKISVLESPDTLSKKVVLSFYEDKSGAIWIGTYNEGLYRYKNGKFCRFTKDEGMLDEVIYQIFEDKNGNIWMSSNLGIFGINRNKLDEYAEGKKTSLSSLEYILLNDLLGIECNGGSQPAGCMTKEGKMWFPTMAGALVLDPDLIDTDNEAPKSKITGIVADNNWLDYTTEVELDAGTERLEIHYTALDYYSAENLTFKYKLEPFDNDWVYAGNRRTAFYTNIPNGEYRFSVIASNGYHLWSNEPTVFSFYKKPKFYETLWFYTSVAVFVLFITYAGFRWRVQELKKREKKLIRIVNERTKELQESEERLKQLNLNKDKFFSQISHDLKSVFMSLMGFSDVLVNDLKKLSIEDIFKFTKNINDSVRYLYNLMNNLLDWSRVQLGKMEYKPNKIELYEAVSKVIRVINSSAEMKNITLRNMIPADHKIYADEGMFYSIINNLFTNSIKFTKPGGVIEVTSLKRDDNYEITIKDSGIGMPKEILEKIFKIEEIQSSPGTDNEKGTGLGLILCKDFVMKNKGVISIKSEPGKGTAVTITLPEFEN